jgi:BirA family biotin operon repressor/biotin-[acetyl-CoA-carboxylase] ligase
MIDSTQLAVLKKVSFFEALDDEELTSLLPYIEKETFKKGIIVFKTGSRGNKVYFLVSGKVSVIKVLSMNLDYLGYEPQQIVETLGTFEDCEVFTISKDSFDKIITENREIAQKMLLAFCNSLASWIRTYDKKLIENAQNITLIEMLRTEKKKIAAMHKITRSAVFNTLTQVLDTILEACMDCLNVEKGSVMIFKDGHLRVEAAFGLDKFEITDKALEVTESSVSGRCFITGKPLLVDDITTVEGLDRSGDGTKYFNNSLLSVPLITLKGETIGVLNLNNKTSQAIFNEQDKVMLQDLGQEAASILGYEMDLLKDRTKTTVLSGNKIVSATKKSLPKDLTSLVEFVNQTTKYKIIYEDFVRSTNDIAREFVKKGHSHGTVVIANAQSHGKGRSGKQWFSPPGFNIYMSIVVKPSLPNLADRIPLVNLVASLSIVKAIKNLTGLNAWPKWPNDIYYSNKILGGILSESLITGGTLDGLLTGIGINVNQEIFPEHLKSVSTSVFLETDKKCNRGDLIIEILKNFSHYYNLFLTNTKAIVNEWTHLSKIKNARVRAVTGKREFHGTVIGLNDQGMLMLEQTDHEVISLASAEIFYLSPN